MRELDLPNGVQVRVSTRAKRMQLVAATGKGIELVLPKRPPSCHAIQRFLASRSAWIERHLQLQLQVEQLRTLSNGSMLPWLGRATTLSLLPGVSTRAQYTTAEINLTYKEGEEDVDLEHALRSLYRSEAHKLLTTEVQELATIQGVTPGTLSIRNQKTIWGSCSARGDLSLNWRLLAMPTQTREYILHHELAHIVWRNHGPRFWSRVEKYAPQYKQQKVWLREHGPQLLNFLRGGTSFERSS